MEIRSGDYGYDINFSVKQSGGTAIQVLTGSTIKFQIKYADKDINILDKACVIVDGAAGTCKYTVASGDFPDEGNYIGCLKIKFSESKEVSTKDINIVIKPAIKK